MNILKKIICLFVILILTNCANYKVDKSKIELEKKLYSSSGFALIYDDALYSQGIVSKRLANDEIAVMHSVIKRNADIKIINPLTLKEITTRVFKRADYPKIFNIVISRKMAEELELDFDNPYVEVIQLKKNATFIAKKGTTYEEEKNVAAKVPVEKIEIDNLSTKKIIKKQKNKNSKKLFFLIISDFYYQDSALDLKEELYTKTRLNNLSIKKINDKKYRLYAGPFKNFNSLKLTYISLNKIGFDDLNIIRE
jgi:hypothetical protein